MPTVLFVAPYFTENGVRFTSAVAALPGVRCGLISQEPQEKLPLDIQSRLAAHWRVDDALDPAQLRWAVEELSARLGPPDRLLGTVEQVQVQLAVVREALGIPGMPAETARNFRDKARMKELLRAAGLPVARHRPVRSPADAWEFVAETGYPLVLKPLDGAGSQNTFRIEDAPALQDALDRIRPGAGREAIAEEFVTGEEHSFEVVTVQGRPRWHAWTRYLPTPLEAMRNPWIQWSVLLPRETEDAAYDDVRALGLRALQVLGMQNGLSHMEWFRRGDGGVVISEIAARPPGAQIMTLNSRAHDADFVALWARLMVEGTFDPPQRRYAAGAAFLRGMGQGYVHAVHGVEELQRAVGPLITDLRLPSPGQPAALSYEGEGYVVVRHPETDVVAAALRRIVDLVRVELRA